MQYVNSPSHSPSHSKPPLLLNNSSMEDTLRRYRDDIKVAGSLLYMILPDKETFLHRYTFYLSIPDTMRQIKLPSLIRRVWPHLNTIIKPLIETSMCLYYRGLLEGFSV